MAGFIRYRRRFDALTRHARERFERAQWRAGQQASTERIEIYARQVTQVVARLLPRGVRPDAATWNAARSLFAALSARRRDVELAETFFNSVYCRIWQHENIDDGNIFVWPSHPVVTEGAPPESVYRTFTPAAGLRPYETIRRILRVYAFDIPWRDPQRDAIRILRAVLADRPDLFRAGRLPRVEMLEPAFYRNKGAYLIGRIVDGVHFYPFAVAILHDEAAGALYVDTLITDPEELSILFSFTRSYFMVYAPTPSAVIAFLKSLLPAKKVFELYSATGFYRHAKTEFYRDLLHHLQHSQDHFVTAPGIKGMVMAVFTLPSYAMVFKIIKDRFSPQKKTTHASVRASYRLVKMHDRVGRMADTQEFSNLRLPRARFDPDLLDELLEVAPSAVVLTEDEVLVRHCYTERMMKPLNLYVENLDPAALREVLDEYGKAIKQLAAAGIFPGDMLLKNFGVTRHGRVVFYDYDEICDLDVVNFRSIPEPRTPEEEMAAEPWYSVGVNDVFPEEFARFLLGDADARRIFTELHGEIFDVQWWRSMQQAVREGRVVDVFPYRRQRCFAERFGSSVTSPTHREEQ